MTPPIPLSPAPTLAGETATRLRPSNVPKGRVAEQFYSQQHGKQTCRAWPVGRALRRWKTTCGLTAQDVRIERISNARPTAKLIPMLKRLGSETRSPATQGLGDITMRELRPARSAEMPSRFSARPAMPPRFVEVAA